MRYYEPAKSKGLFVKLLSKSQIYVISMFFNSLTYAIFLPIVFLLYWFVFQKNLKLQNLFIIAVSYLFYGWWDYRFLFLIVFTTACSYLSGVLISKARSINRGESRDHSFGIATVNIVLNLAILGIFKYYNFFAENLDALFRCFGIELGWVTLRILLPAGISFYTFQALSYTIDVYRQKLPATRDPLSFFAFVSFFPQLVAGPIERANNLLPQFQKSRTFNYSQAVDGMREILWGLFKKIVIADTCANSVNIIFNEWADVHLVGLWIGAFLFTIQIYCDFSGYSHIAIGTARLFGINLMQNFNYPYFSRDIAEFWRRWHISLSTWFRDYVYIPLGGSRGTKMLVLRNTFVIFALSGFWHGANWTFIMWGLYHAILFIPLMLMQKNRVNTNIVADGRLLPNFKELTQLIITFLFVMFGLVLFRAETMTDAVGYICAMFSVKQHSHIPDAAHGVRMQVVCCLIIIMFTVEWLQRTKRHALQIEGESPMNAILHHRLGRHLLYTILLLITSLFIYGVPAQFIYFQF